MTRSELPNGRWTSLLKEAYERLMREKHAGWCKVWPANRCGNNSYNTSEAEEKFCDCGFSAWHVKAEKVLGLPVVNLWRAKEKP